MAETRRVGVVGGGLGGLAAACVLAARGYAVTLFERNAWLGGKAAVLSAGGYRFDMGPTILTLPSVLRRIFAEAGRPLEDALTLLPCDPQWRSFFDGGGTLDLSADRAKMLRSLEAFAPGSGPGYERFLDFAGRLHGISERFFFWRSVGSLWDMFEWKSSFDPALLRDVLAMKMGRTVAECVRQSVPEPRVAQMIDHFTQYVGSAPDASPAVLCGIAHMQTQEGVWYPLGGTRAVPEALVKLAGGLGVELRTGVGVRRILFDEARRAVTGVETDAGEQVPLAAVVSNADSVRTHRELLGGRPARRFARRRKYEPACSGVVLYLGLDRAYDHLAHHNFVFSRDAHEEFECIYRQGKPAPDPTCYVAAPGRSEPGVAPAGGEALYVLVHTPYLRPGQDWAQMLPAYRKTILDKLARTAGLADIERRIRFEAHLTPQDIHDRYHVLDGAIYGLASHGRLTGAFKPANRSPDLKGLYLAGGAAHPGPGMPMVLMSGWIAADTLDRDGTVDKGGRPASASQGAPAAGAASLNGHTPPAVAGVARSGQGDAPAGALPRRVPWRVKLCTRYFRGWMGKNFHAIRLSRTGRPPDVQGRPLLVVLNHPSWWDPLLGMILADLFDGYRHYVPIDAAALAKYPFFESLGFFGVEAGDPRGAIPFLRKATAVLARRHNALWVTAQGRFTDPRERPVQLRKGVGHLVRRLHDAVVLPLAVEYPFWHERFPESLAHFGEPLFVGSGREHPVEGWMARIQAGLTAAQDELARLAQAQDPNPFDVLVDGSLGVGGIYQFWRRVKMMLVGKSFHPGHDFSSISPVQQTGSASISPVQQPGSASISPVQQTGSGMQMGGGS
jgi:phytoene desaturase